MCPVTATDTQPRVAHLGCRHVVLHSVPAAAAYEDLHPRWPDVPRFNRIQRSGFLPRNLPIKKIPPTDMKSLWCTPKTNVIHQLHLNKKTSQFNRQIIDVIEYTTSYMKQTKNQSSDQLSRSGSVWAADALLPHTWFADTPLIPQPAPGVSMASAQLTCPSPV